MIERERERESVCVCVCVLQLCWALDYIALDPTFGSFTLLIRTSFTSGALIFLVKVFKLFKFLLEPASHLVHRFFLVKVFRLFKLEQICLVFRVWTHLQ